MTQEGNTQDNLIVMKFSNRRRKVKRWMGDNQPVVVAGLMVVGIGVIATVSVRAVVRAETSAAASRLMVIHALNDWAEAARDAGMLDPSR